MGELNNPYAAPKDPVDSPAEGGRVLRDRSGRFVPAGLAARAGGGVLDLLFSGVLLLAMGVVLGLVTQGELLMPNEVYSRSTALQGIRDLLGPVVVLGCQALLIARRGQSFGKIVMGTCIVGADGRVADLYRGFVLRTLPFTGTAMMANLFGVGQSMRTIVGLVWIVDSLMIFGVGAQCGHDRLASTFVAKVRSGR